MGSVAKIVAVGLFVTLAMPANAAEVFVAGVHPDRRPEGAPRLEWRIHPRPWFEKALTGVVPPYAPSLWFLDAQGDWYTPFAVAGMTGRYDIRGWHAAEAK